MAFTLQAKPQPQGTHLCLSTRTHAQACTHTHTLKHVPTEQFQLNSYVRWGDTQPTMFKCIAMLIHRWTNGNICTHCRAKYAWESSACELMWRHTDTDTSLMWRLGFCLFVFLNQNSQFDLSILECWEPQTCGNCSPELHKGWLRPRHRWIMSSTLISAWF